MAYNIKFFRGGRSSPPATVRYPLSLLHCDGDLDLAPKSRFTEPVLHVFATAICDFPLSPVSIEVHTKAVSPFKYFLIFYFIFLRFSLSGSPFQSFLFLS